MWLHGDYNCNVFNTLLVYSIRHVDMFFLWRICGPLCGEQLGSWRWKRGIVSGESFPSHWPSHPYSGISRHLKVEKDGLKHRRDPPVTPL